jgi:protein-tyrosine phosphatase
MKRLMDAGNDDSDNEELYLQLSKTIYRPAVISEIIKDKLYLADRHIANDLETLENHGITRIIALGTIDDHDEYQIFDKIDYLHLFIDDAASETIDVYFNLCHKMIDEDHVVLVHCYAGISRSATIVIAYIMMSQKLCYEDALEFVRSKRSFICPNDGFQSQLMNFKFK